MSKAGPESTQKSDNKPLRIVVYLGSLLRAWFSTPLILSCQCLYHAHGQTWSTSGSDLSAPDPASCFRESGCLLTQSRLILVCAGTIDTRIKNCESNRLHTSLSRPALWVAPPSHDHQEIQRIYIPYRQRNIPLLSPKSMTQNLCLTSSLLSSSRMS